MTTQLQSFDKDFFGAPPVADFGIDITDVPLPINPAGTLVTGNPAIDTPGFNGDANIETSTPVSTKAPPISPAAALTLAQAQVAQGMAQTAIAPPPPGDPHNSRVDRKIPPPPQPAPSFSLPLNPFNIPGLPSNLPSIPGLPGGLPAPQQPELGGLGTLMNLYRWVENNKVIVGLGIGAFALTALYAQIHVAKAAAPYIIKYGTRAAML